MGNPQLLKSLEQAIAAGELSKSEVLSLFESKQAKVQSEGSKLSLIFSYIGGIVVVLGIGFLVGENWDRLNVPARILVTLGLGVISHFSSLFLGNEARFKHLSQAFYIIAVLLLSLGVFVSLDAAHVDIDEGTTSLVFGLLALMQALTFWAVRKNLSLLFTIVFASIALVYGVHGDSNTALTLFVLGLAYIGLGRYFMMNMERKQLTPVLFDFGSFFTLAAAFYLVVEAGGIWMLLFPFIDIGNLILSVKLKNRAFLGFASLFLIIYIVYMSAEIFGDSLGWPLVLVMSGLSLVGIGYGSLQFSKKYLS